MKLQIWCGNFYELTVKFNDSQKNINETSAEKLMPKTPLYVNIVSIFMVISIWLV